MANETVWFAFLVSAALKSSLVLGAAGLAAWCLRGRSSAARHLVWTAAAAAVLALPFLSASLPKFGVPGADAVLPSASSLVFRTTASDTAGGLNTGNSANLTTTHASAPGAGGRGFDWPLILMSLWAAGVAISMLRALAAWIALASVRRSSRPFPDASLAGELAQSLGVTGSVNVLETAPGSMPMTFGIWRSTVFMPADASEWTDERRRVVLLHELAHVRRGDAALHWMARAALALHWWNPLAWMAWREFLKERERAADDLVLNAGARASDYAGHLLEVARTMRLKPVTAWASVAMARSSQLEGRLLAILDSKIDRNTPGRLSVAAVALAAMAVVAPFAAVQAQDRVDPSMMPDVAATIRAAVAQKNYAMLDQAAEGFVKLGRYDAAQQLSEQALAIRSEVKGEQSVEYAIGLVKLGEIQLKGGKVIQANGNFAKAVSLGDRPEVTSALLHLGLRELAAQNSDDALDFLRRASNMAQSPQDIGRALTYMALTYERKPDGADQAESYYQRAISVEGGVYPMAANTMELYARFLTDHGRGEEAQVQKENALAIRKPHFAELKMPSPGNSEVYRANQAVVGPIPQAKVTSPVLVSKVEPQYTEEARIAKLQGVVVLWVEIGPDGRVHNARVLKALGLGLDESAITTVGQWKFTPGLKNALPVTVAATIEVNFRLL